MLEITLVRGLIGCNPRQRKTLKALGLKKIRATKVCNDIPSVHGMLRVIRHLVEVKKK